MSKRNKLPTAPKLAVTYPDKPAARRELMRCGFWLKHHPKLEVWSHTDYPNRYGLIAIRGRIRIAKMPQQDGD